MSRQKKTRKITDIMPTRRSESTAAEPRLHVGKNRKPSRYELDLQARDAKKKRKHKGLPSGARLQDPAEQKKAEIKTTKDPRIGSRKKVPLVVEFVNKPEKGQFIPPVKAEVAAKPALSLADELAQLENNECLHQLLDDLEAGKTLSSTDQKFVDDCLDRIDALMNELGISNEEPSEDALLRQFETLDINQFR